MANDAMRAIEFFDRALKGFRYSYPSARFINERDVVSDIQARLQDIVSVQEPQWRVFHNERAIDKNNSKILVDLAVMREGPTAEDDSIMLAIEFKFEPDHERNDIRKRKLPLSTYPAIGADVSIVSEIVSAVAPRLVSLYLLMKASIITGNKNTNRIHVAVGRSGDALDRDPVL